jgi:FkbM family methyltransferase
MFILQEYDLKTNYEVKTIIDCGANIGLASLFFLTKYPTAKIIAIEPELNNFKMVNQNLKSYPNVTCINKGIWNKKTYLKIIDEGRGNHSFKVIECNSPSGVCIEAITIDEIINDFQLKSIDILKIDIEGSEEQVFSNEPEWIKKVRMIFCEIHENMKPGLTKKIIKELSHSFNISRKDEYHVFSRKSN